MKTNPNSLSAAIATLAATLTGPTTAAAQTFTTLKTFNNSNFFESGPVADTGLTLSDGMLYGTGGTLYKVSTNGGDFSVIHQFTGDFWLSGRGRVAVSGDTIYGVTRYGGSTEGDTLGYGIIYRVNTDGTGFTVLREFNKAGGDGYQPAFGLILSGSTLYGTTTGGGTFDRGVVFKINTNGTGYQNIHSFNYATDGVQPQSELTLIGNTLYGTTLSGSIPTLPNGGMLFKIDLDGTGFAVLHTFSNPLIEVWSEFMNGVTAVGDTLYGVGRNYGSGPDFHDPISCVYKIKTNGTGFQIIRQLPTGSSFGGVLSWTGTLLMGSRHDSASLGGKPSGGIFQMNTDGTGYHVINTFAGASAYAVDLVFSGTTLYGGRFDFDFGEEPEPSALFSLDVRPRLALVTAGPNVKISWPSYAHDYVLEKSPTVAPGSWTNVIEAAADDGTNRMATLPVSPLAPAMFFRLRR